MSSSKQLHSLEQFLAQAQGPSVSWADVDDDPELYATMDEPALETVEETPAPSRTSSRHSMPMLPDSPPFVIYCGNLPYNCTDKHLSEFFSPIKPVEVRVVIDPSTKRGKGFGYVEFRTRTDMERAFERNAQPLLDRPIRIDVQNRENASERRQRHHAPPPTPSVPAERPKLVLKPRTVDSNKPTGSTPTQKVNPFGAARPREEVLKEKAAAATATVTADEQKHASDRRSRSPAAHSRLPPAPIQQKSAWGPISSVMQPAPPSTEPATTPKVEPQQRPAWTGRRPTSSRADAEHHDSRSSKPTPTNRSHQLEQRPQGSAISRPITPQNADHERRGPVRPHERPGLRPQNGSDRKSCPRPTTGDNRPRHRHDDRRSSREKPVEPAPSTDVVENQPRPKPSPAERARSHSPSHADADELGFEVPRKGRRNGSGRHAAGLSLTMSKVNLNSNRKEKTTSKSSSRPVAPPAEIASSVAYSSNPFNRLADLSDE